MSPAHRRSQPPAVCWGAACARRARQEAQQATVQALMQALELKDPYTRGHSERVGGLAVLIARELGAPEPRVEAAHLGGTLHDIGKLAVPTGLLRKNGPLTDEERGVIRLHPADGDGVLRGIQALDEARAAVLHHHERVDGTGYPYGLCGARIPEAARIVAVADAFDAMTSTRSYRPACSEAPALAELRRCAGTQFDPLMVEALAGALRARSRTVVPVADGRGGQGETAGSRTGTEGGPRGLSGGGSGTGDGPAALSRPAPAALRGATAAGEGPLLARVPAQPPTWAWLDAGAKGKGVG